MSHCASADVIWQISIGWNYNFPAQGCAFGRLEIRITKKRQIQNQNCSWHSLPCLILIYSRNFNFCVKCFIFLTYIREKWYLNKISKNGNSLSEKGKKIILACQTAEFSIYSLFRRRFLKKK